MDNGFYNDINFKLIEYLIFIWRPSLRTLFVLEIDLASL